MSLNNDERERLLAGCSLFMGLPPEGLAVLGRRATEVEFPAGHVIARQGEIGSGLFIIINGAVKVVRSGEQLARLKAGDFFGELSVLDRMPRTASVTTEEETRCLALASWDFDAAVTESPSIALAILRGLALRLRERTEADRH
jgi:CRP/FNR family transcriptional regulator, cyclic AMP receptor protein